MASSLMETLLGGGEEGEKILVQGWIFFNSSYAQRVATITRHFIVVWLWRQNTVPCSYM